MFDWYKHWLSLGFEGLENVLAQGPLIGAFSHGDTLGLLSICLFPQIFNTWRNDQNMSPYLTIGRVAAACDELDAFTAACPCRQPDAQ